MPADLANLQLISMPDKAYSRVDGIASSAPVSKVLGTSPYNSAARPAKVKLVKWPSETRSGNVNNYRIFGVVFEVEYLQG